MWMFRIAIKKLFEWLFSRMLASHHGGPSGTCQSMGMHLFGAVHCKKFDKVVRHQHVVAQDQFSLVSKKDSGIPKGNFNKKLKFFDRLSQMLNFFAINTFPTSNFLDDDNRTSSNFLQLSNFFDIG
jgi:hypothetical protein